MENLTKRKLEIAYWVAKGVTNKAVGTQLRISEKTVKNTMTSVYRELGLRGAGKRYRLAEIMAAMEEKTA